MSNCKTAGPVVILARSHSDLVNAIRDELDRSGARPAVLDLEDTAAIPNEVGPVVVVSDGNSARRGRWWTSRRDREWEDRVCALTFQLMASSDDRRLLVLGDARNASPADRRRSIRWARQLALRIRYECAINGLNSMTVMYKVVVDSTGIPPAAASIAWWCTTGRAGAGPSGATAETLPTLPAADGLAQRSPPALTRRVAVAATPT